MSVIYDEQARLLAFTEIAQDILRGAQNELYLNMRFLDVALATLKPLPDGQIRTAGTDGVFYYFQPDQLTVVFRQGREYVNRLYLHSILHCLFAHLWVRKDRDPEYWNLACDVAVEAIIDGLYIRALHRPMSALRREFYHTLSTETEVHSPNEAGTSFSKQKPSGEAASSIGQNHLGQTASSDRQKYPDISEASPAQNVSRPALTAQRVYRYLCRVHPVQAQLDRLKREFAVDDHSRWEEERSTNTPPRSAKEQAILSAPPQSLTEQNQNPSAPAPDHTQLPCMPAPQQNSQDSSQEQQQSQNPSDDFPPEARKRWEDIRDRMQTEMETFGKDTSDNMEALEEQISAANRRHYDYRDFLRKFSVLKEEMQVDLDSFDYIYYNYGMDLYGNMPLIEPLETKEVKKIEDFVIVLDTSLSCKGDLLLHFLEETYSILSESESFFRKIHVHILQCDDKVQEDVLITNQEEMRDYLEHFTIRGFGGTDFRPPFARVQELARRGCFTKLRGLIYFTDGYGIFPVKKPPYDTAFVFLKEDFCDVDVPPWAIKLILDREELEEIAAATLST
ncbi:MAG: VWA-like domain-containing protein [Lachnospiraceae bacterium]|nr:VWA-like domain-containing protein [Lachnospiraceae bacterium]